MTSETTVVTEVVKPIRAKHLAAKFGMKATAFRRILRTMPEYADGVHTNYAWAENDAKAFKRIEGVIAGLKAKREAAAKEAKDKIAKAEAEAKAAAKQDAKIA